MSALSRLALLLLVPLSAAGALWVASGRDDRGAAAAAVHFDPAARDGPTMHHRGLRTSRHDAKPLGALVAAPSDQREARAMVAFCDTAGAADVADLRGVALTATDALSAGNAVRALGRLRLVAGDAELTALLADARPRVRDETILALGESGDPSAVTKLEPLLASTVQRAAAAPLRAPWRASLPCAFEEHTSDVDDNAILLWTLDRVLRSGLCTDRSLPTIRAAHRRIGGHATPRSFVGSDCVDRVYSRLNADYEPLHGLCRFFLENSGPTHEHGDRSVLPFLVHMPRLFEGFVAAWLEEHARSQYFVDVQHPIDFEGGSDLKMFVDVVLSDPITRQTVAVMDTKYKVDAPTNTDVAQVVTYAHALGCRRALLVYPNARKPFHVTVGDITVTAVTFSIADDLNRAGAQFLRTIDELIVRSPLQ